ncbi:hypothetical protein ACG7TL_003002 [Trametes sanguinea]
MQLALLTSELEEIFANAPRAPSAVAHDRIRNAYAQATGKAVASTSQTNAKKRIPGKDDDCPVCYENMHGIAEKLLTFCEECGNGLHLQCFQEWARTAKGGVTCVFCRAKWIAPPIAGASNSSGRFSEGYLNLADVAGIITVPHEVADITASASPQTTSEYYILNVAMAPSATNGSSSDVHNGASQQPAAAVGTLPSLPKFVSKEKEREFLKFRLAQAFRIFGKLGYDEGVAGHITVRGKHFSLIQPSDLILVDHHGNVLAEESGPNKLLNKAAFMIHSAIHAARPDVNCAAHSHSVYGRAFSTFGKHLDMITQDSCAFYQDHGVYDQYGGVVLDEEEGAHIVKALGNKKNHGILVASDTIEATVHFFIALEKSCQVQLLADAAAASMGKKPVIINDADAKKSHSVVGTMFGGWFSGQPHFQLLEAAEGVKFDVEKGIVVKL